MRQTHSLILCIALLLCVTGSLHAAAKGKQKAKANDSTASQTSHTEGTLTVDPSGSIARLMDKGRYQGRSYFSMFDRNKSISLEKKELKDFMGEHVDPLFQLCDVDRNGKITRSELRKGAKKADPSIGFKTEINEERAALLAARNGGRNRYKAWAFFGRQRSFIGDYEVSGNGNLDPVISTVNVGDFIGVQDLVVYQH